MYRKIAAGLAIVIIGTSILGGCKKKEETAPSEAPQTTEAPVAQPPAAPGAPPATTETAAGSGEALFKQHCASCHPDGGNTMKPEHTLKRDHLKTHNITKPEDIVKLMRNPGPGMPKYDPTAVPDQDATAIAEYVLKTF